MFCKSCEYPLWNLTARQCPECGATFKPSDFEFAINSIRFCCPHCRQHYFGTDPQGLLVPRQFECVACHQRIDMDEMVLLPAEGWNEEQTRAAEVPWTKRKKIGFWRGWFGTIAMSMTSPSKLIRALPIEGQSRGAFWFAVLTNFCFMFIGIAMSVLLMFLIGMMFAQGPQGVAGAASGAIFFTGTLTIVPILFFSLAIFLWALAAHGLLRLTGPTRYGPRRTFDALCYANGANILAAIPCCGPYMQSAAWIWSGVSATIMLRQTHQVNGFRAALAVFTPPLAVVGVVVGLFMWAMANVASMGTTFVHSNMAHGAARSAGAVIDWARDHGGQPPRHAFELVESGLVFSGVFTDWSNRDTSVAGVDPMQMYALDPVERKAAVERVVLSMPSGIIAHRVGNSVFTYHGIVFPPAGQPDARLWVVVMESPNARRLIAGLADGSTIEIGYAELPRMLSEQNQVREAEGLAPLPDLASVTIASPAVAGPGGP